jgi:hypothetical protein
MGRFVTLLVLSIAVAFPLLAQDTPKLEVFGGYQFLHAGNFDGLGESANTNGWDTSATFNFARHFGAVADFSGNYKTEQTVNSNLGSQSYLAVVRIYTYTFGPQASVNVSENFKIFAHALFGGAHVRPTACVIFSGNSVECGSGAATGFAMMVGGGVDAKMTKRADLRMVQVDWVRLPSEFGAQNGDVRVSTGVVFRF